MIMITAIPAASRSPVKIASAARGANNAGLLDDYGRCSPGQAGDVFC